MSLKTANHGHLQRRKSSEKLVAIPPDNIYFMLKEQLGF